MSLHFLSRAARRLARRLAAVAQAPARETDPIDHPAIAAMGLREIADLPLAPARSLAEPPSAEQTAGRKLSCSAAA